MNYKQRKQLIKDQVMKPIEAAGFQIYFVGGCVRDELLDKEPHDLDLVGSARPEDLHKIFTKFSNVSDNAETFGVTIVLIPFEDSYEEVEIATFRKDITEGRHPEVSLDATIEEDASRRDFTINALYETVDGKIVDPTGHGVSDIERKVLRFVGEPLDRLREDPLRAYRFVRFGSTLHFRSPYDYSSISSFKSVLNFSGVSKERKLKEIKRILGSLGFYPNSESFMIAEAIGIFEDMGLSDIFNEMKKVEQSWRWHAEGGIFQEFGLYSGLGELVVASEIDQDISNTIPYRHGTVYEHTLLTWKAMNLLFRSGRTGSFGIPEEINKDFKDERWLLVLSAILHDIGKIHCEHQGVKTNTFTHLGRTFTEVVPKVSDHPMVGVSYAEEFCKNLGMSNAETEFVKEMVREHMNAHELTKASRFHKIFHFVKKPLYKEIMLVAYADELGSIKLEGHEERGSVPEMVKDERVVKAVAMETPDPVLTGNDLIKFQRTPGPLFKKMLETAYNVQLDQNISDKDLLYKMVKNVELSSEEL